MGPLDIDVILRFRRFSFNMPQGFMRMPRLLDFDLGIGIHTCMYR